MIKVGLDTETRLIQPGLLAPPMVCVSFAEQHPGQAGVALWSDDLSWLRRYLESATLILHNAAFDMAVLAAFDDTLLPLIFKAYDEGRIKDTKIRQQLIDIGRGRKSINGVPFAIRGGELVRASYSLADLEQLYFGRDRSSEKNDPDSWRLRYAELEDIPVDQWPDAAYDYALADAEGALEVYEAQEVDKEYLATEDLQARADFALHLASCWGMRTDGQAVDELEAALLKESERNNKRINQAGFIKSRRATPQEVAENKVDFWEDSKRGPRPMRYAKDTKAIQAYVTRVYERAGKEIPYTESGKISTSKDTCYESGSRLLRAVADGGGVDKILNTYIPILKRGTQVPINASYNVLVNSGRTSCIAKGSLVDVVRDVSKAPKGIPIEDVKVGDMAYCFDDKGLLTLRPVTWSGKTGHRKVLRVHWRGTGKRHRGHLDLTPEHPVRLTSGEYVPAGSLTKGASVMALHRGVSQGYARMWATNVGEISREHRFVYAVLKGELPEHVHHLNENKLDNRIENLEGLTAAEHTSHHSSNPSGDVRESRSRHMKEKWVAGVFRGMSGAENPRWLGLTKEWIEEELAKAAGQATKVCQSNDMDFDTFKKHCKLNGVNLKDWANRYTQDGVLIDRAYVEEKRKAFEYLPYREARKNTGMNFYRWAEVQKAQGFDIPFNHTVEAVEELEDAVDVYDLTIEGTHNFIVNELCVHNCRNPNYQNLPTGRRVGGVRECHTPSPGMIYSTTDYSTLELLALAQTCLWVLGVSKMAEAINDGQDLHLAVASSSLRIDYDEAKARYDSGDKAVKLARNVAKVANFGLPGGLGIQSLIDFARSGYGMRFTFDEAKRIKEEWTAAWPEMKDYFKWINDLVGYGEARITHPKTGYVRGALGYTEACNHFFQHLAAMGAKEALYNLTKEMYTDKDSALFGSRLVAFIHDEFICEHPEDRMHEAATRVSEVAVASMKKFIPDLNVKAEPALMRRWYKEAETVRDDNGRLIPWEPDNKKAA